ncbi:hypothetical protein ACJMK2_018095 [Sinanodonta woodiana]|uniref:non-specific serine/threonine protein kinase n=1 Tax=Sinanodonta woodiana TaxID=1069815 RepID=A0ABD3UCC4_SINWO
MASPKYDLLRLLGSGTYGQAWLARENKTQRKCVVKVIKVANLTDKEVERCVTEVEILASCNHVNVVRYSKAYIDAGALNIVMEYAAGGDLQKKIKEQNGMHLQKETVLDWFIQVCQALRYIHDKNILHRDLKTQNVFLTSHGIIKVGDFGIARMLRNQDDHALTTIGTPLYISPEICLRKPYNSKSDMWAAGCLLYELCCLRAPFDGPDLTSLIIKIVNGQYPPIPEQFGPFLSNIITRLLVSDTEKRLSAAEVLTLPEIMASIDRQCKQLQQQNLRSHNPRSHSVSVNKSPSESRVKPRAPSCGEPVSQFKRQQWKDLPPATIKVDTAEVISGKNDRFKNGNKNVESEFRQNARKQNAVPHDLGNIPSREREPHGLGNLSSREQEKAFQRKDANSDNDTNEQMKDNVRSRENVVEGSEINAKDILKDLTNMPSYDKVNRKQDDRDQNTPPCVMKESKSPCCVLNRETFIVRTPMLRHLSTVSPKLCGTIRRQKEALFVERNGQPQSTKKPGPQMCLTDQMIPPNTSLYTPLEQRVSETEECHDDSGDVFGAFQEQSVVMKSKKVEKIDSRTYVIQTTGPKDSKINLSAEVDVNPMIYLALSVCENDPNLGKEILDRTLRQIVGPHRNKHLLEMVKKFLLTGASYQDLLENLDDAEVAALPIVFQIMSWK